MVGQCEKETEQASTTPVDSWQLAKIRSERKGWKQIAPSNTEEQDLQHVVEPQPNCIILLTTFSHLFPLEHSSGINPKVIMLVRVTGSVACVETPIGFRLHLSCASGLPKNTHARLKLNSVARIENNHTLRLRAQSPVSVFNKDSK